MAIKVDTFRSDSGATFENERDAWRDDLRHWLTKSGHVNDGAAEKLTKAMTEDRETIDAIVTMLTKVRDHTPYAVQAAPAYPGDTAPPPPSDPWPDARPPLQARGYRL